MDLTNIFDLQPKLATLETRLKEKAGPDAYPQVDLSINWTSFTPIRLRASAGLTGVKGPFPNGEEATNIETADTLAFALDLIETWIDQIPSREQVQKQAAVTNLGKAIDAAREVGIDVEPFEEPFRTIYDNLLEHRAA